MLVSGLLTKLVSDAGNHLAELGECLRLEQLRLKETLCGKVAVDLDAAEERAFLIKDGARGTLQQARNRADQMQFLAHAAFGAAIRTMPALGEITGICGARTERANEIVEGLDAPELFGRYTDDLAKRLFRARISWFGPKSTTPSSSHSITFKTSVTPINAPIIGLSGESSTSCSTVRKLTSNSVGNGGYGDSLDHSAGVISSSFSATIPRKVVCWPESTTP
jgi:hypothetical protein